MAWTGKILRVDLDQGHVSRPEPLNMKWAREYLGQRGLATKYFTEEVDPKVDPLSPDNKMIWATGPAYRNDGLDRRPLFGHHQGGADRRDRLFQLRRLLGRRAARWPAGTWSSSRASRPSRSICSSRTTRPNCCDAGCLWGKSVWDTEARDQDEASGSADPRVLASAAPARTRCLYAAVINDLHRAAGRSGVGAVMGSKNLKAIAVRGTKGVGNIRDPKAFMKVTCEKKKVLADNAVTGQGLPTVSARRC